MNFSGFTVSNRAITDVRELLFLTIFNSPMVDTVCTVKTGLKDGQKVGWLGGVGAVGTAGAGCDPTYSSLTPTGEEKTWVLKAYEIAKSICYTEIENTIAQDALKTGTAIGELLETDYMDYVVMPLLERAIADFYWRVIWFGDTAAKNVAPTNGGVITEGVDLNLIKVCDGLWKRLFAIVASDSTKKTAIAANKEASYAAAKTAMRVKGVATGILDKIIDEADDRILQEGGVLLCNYDFVKALKADIKAVYGTNTMPFEKVFSGIEVGEYNGVKVVGLMKWDEMIKTYETTATGVRNLPYRIVYAPISNLMVGTNDTEMAPTASLTFNEVDRKNYIYLSSKIGTMIGEDSLVHVAY